AVAGGSVAWSRHDCARRRVARDPRAAGAPGHVRSPFRRRALRQPQHAGRPAGRGSVGSMIGFDQALAIVADVAAAHRLPVESRSLSRAHGHVLARDVTAPIALPPFDNSAMDGFALRSADLSAEGDTVLGLARSEEHTSELQSRENLVCRLLLEKKKHKTKAT